MRTGNFQQGLPLAEEIPFLDAEEAYQLLNTELERFLDLVELLAGEDWQQPTACSEWNVRNILAHQAGGYAGGASWREMIRQASQRPAPGQLPEDAVNAFQLRERADRSPQDLIAELRRVGPMAVRKWAYGFLPLRLLSIPHPQEGRLSLRRLMWVIHSRDTWMHRLDICRAVGREFIQTREHDGRIVELVMRDAAEVLRMKPDHQSLIFSLKGISGGAWQTGRGEPAAEVVMDVLEFNIFASGRSSFKDARPGMEITGDVQAAESALQDLLVLY